MASLRGLSKFPTTPITFKKQYRNYPGIKYPIIEHNGKYYKLHSKNNSGNYRNSELIKCNPLLNNEDIVPLIMKSKKIKFIWIIGTNKDIDIDEASCDDLDIWFKQTKSIDEICSKHMNAVRQSKIIHLLYAGEMMITKQQEQYQIDINFSSGTFMEPISNNIITHFDSVTRCVSNILDRILNGLNYNLKFHKEITSFIEKNNTISMNNFLELSRLESMSILKSNNKANLLSMDRKVFNLIGLESELSQMEQLKRFYKPEEYIIELEKIKQKIKNVKNKQNSILSSTISSNNLRNQLLGNRPNSSVASASSENRSESVSEEYPEHTSRQKRKTTEKRKQNKETNQSQLRRSSRLKFQKK